MKAATDTNNSHGQPEIYRGYTIVEVFRYDSGVSDWNVFAPDGDYGYMMPYVSRDIVEADIDEKLSEEMYE